MHRSLFLFAFVIFVGGVSGQPPVGFDLSNYGVRVEPDKRLIVVLSTLQAAGTQGSDGKFKSLLNTPLSSSGEKVREKLIRDNADVPDDLRIRITAFLAQYKRLHPEATEAQLVTPFISMAYALSPAPELLDPLVTSDLPGNLLDVLDFAPLVREYYRRSAISAKLDGYVKESKLAAANPLETSTREMVSGLLDYLHTRPQLIFAERVKVQTSKVGSKKKIDSVEVRQRDRHFVVVPEALAPKGNVNFLNIRDDYYLVIPPDTDLTSSEGRRAFLRFVMDPLVLANAKDMQPVRNWAKAVLDDLRKSDPNISTDPFLTMSRSLVAAADVRENEFRKTRIATAIARQKLALLKTDAEKREVTALLEKQKREFVDEAVLQLYEEYQKGAILSFYFADQLKGVEESGFDIASSLKEMVLSFEPAKEADRLNSTAAARKRALAARAAHTADPKGATLLVENPVTTRLVDIQRSIDAKNLSKAQGDLKQLLAQYPSEPRIYYNLGRVAGLSAAGILDPDAQAAKLLEAKVAYTNVITSASAGTDPVLLSLTYVALGRVYEFFNDDAYALKLYDKAVQIGNLSGSGYNDAFAAKQRLVKPRQ